MSGLSRAPAHMFVISTGGSQGDLSFGEEAKEGSFGREWGQCLKAGESAQATVVSVGCRAC